MLFKRIFTAIIGIIILSLFIYWGSLPFYFFISALTAITIYEFNKLISENNRINYFFILFLALLIIFCNYFCNFPSEFIYFLIFIILILYLLFTKGYKNMTQSTGIYLLGLLYIGGGFTYFLYLRDFTGEFLFKYGALWLVLISTWATDTGAYFCGKYLGSKKLAKNISPNKTIAGALGGILLTIIVVYILTFFNGFFSIKWFFYSISLALLAIIGDLFESALKRNAGIKDTGKIMPGHGGFLDRFDTLLITVPFTYFFLSIFVW